MIRNAILLLNLFFVVVYQLLFGPAVDVTQQFPDKITPGETFTVTLTINKGDVSGFSKLQQELPNGFTATAGNLEGASFTFSNGVVKFIWMTLPKDETFDVSYTVTTAPTISGTYVISGNFAYLEGSEKQTIQLTEKSIVAVPASGASAQTGNSGNDNEGTTGDNSGNSTTSPTPAPEVTCTRNIDLSRLASDNLITVQLTLSKPGVTGFAKVQETLPAGFKPTALETAQANFSVSDQQAKFVWMTLPAADEITISYQVIVPANSPGEYFINGDFSYLHDNETRKCVFPRDRVIIPSTQLADAGDNQNNQPELREDGNQNTATQQNQPGNNSNTTTNNVAQNEGNNTSAQSGNSKAGKMNNISETPVTNAGGIVYKVQVAATRKQIPAGYFANKYNLPGIAAEMHDGWNKYIIGGFVKYEQARDKRNETSARHDKLIGPFVTAYNNGQRITVQEALMISAQQWVQ